VENFSGKPAQNNSNPVSSTQNHMLHTHTPCIKQQHVDMSVSFTLLVSSESSGLIQSQSGHGNEEESPVNNQ
jgi:hypothetical protein